MWQNRYGDALRQQQKNRFATTMLGDAAELLHRQILKQLLGVRDSTANIFVLAELGRFPS